MWLWKWVLHVDLGLLDPLEGVADGSLWMALFPILLLQTSGLIHRDLGT